MENNIVEDQVQEEVTESTSDTSEEQSETTEDVQEAKAEVYVDHLGREMTAEQLHSEFISQQKYITGLEQKAKARETEIQTEAADAVSKNELLQDVDPNVKEAITRIVTPVIQSALRQRDEADEAKAQDEALKQKFASTAEKYDGKDGYPKFDRTKVINFMLQSQVYDPEKAYLLMNQASIIDAEVRKAMKGGKSSTESTVGSTPEKPQGKAASSWEEASNRAASRI